MKLFILDAIIFLKMVGNYFFVPENMKKHPQKLLIIGANFFFNIATGPLSA